MLLYKDATGLTVSRNTGNGVVGLGDGWRTRGISFRIKRFSMYAGRREFFSFDSFSGAVFLVE